ncbi:hypothetical protein BDW66DRAFT_117544 [Aspergillus desertorum]
MLVRKLGCLLNKQKRDPRARILHCFSATHMPFVIQCAFHGRVISRISPVKEKYQRFSSGPSV